MYLTARMSPEFNGVPNHMSMLLTPLSLQR